ncbi:ABC transporter ATP-binding protein, partial [bacterium]
MSEEFAIDLVGVTRRFGRETAVDDVTLRVPRGSLCGFVGLNGAGKSTTIRIAVGLLRATAGSARLAGCDAVRDHVELCRRVGYVPDRPNVYGWMRVGEAIAFVRKFHAVAWNAARCDDLTRRFRLPLDARVSKLSKGQAAKLQLLLAVCHDPQVLILDEPTSGFDPLVREEFLESVLRVAGEREQTVLFSSHALADVQRLADRVAILHEGRLIAH